MIIVKKEYLERYIGSTRLTLGEMKQGQLESIRAIHGDKYFETTKPNKKPKSSDSTNS